jgi:hypothetical protein
MVREDTVLSTDFIRECYYILISNISFWLLLLIFMKNTEALFLGAGKEMDLEVNAERTMYVLMSHQIAGQSHNLKIANKSFENVAEFRYWGMTVANKITFMKKLRKSRLNSFQNLVCSSLMCENVKIKMYIQNYDCCFVWT